MWSICAIVTWAIITVHVKSVSSGRATTYAYPEFDISNSASYDDPYRMPPPPFSEPGLIFGSLTVRNLLPLAGEVWNAESVVESGRIACEQLQPPLTAVFLDYSNLYAGAEVYLNDVCDHLETSDIEQECNGVWDDVVRSMGRDDLVEGSISLFTDLRCRRRVDYPSLSDGYATSFPRRSLDTVTLRDFNAYDPCSDSGIRRVNGIILALVDWVGPSLFENVVEFGYRGVEPYSLCGIMRFILSSDTADYIQNLIGVLKYPCADFLEEFQPYDLCVVSQLEEPGAEAIGAFKDLLVEFSNLDEDEFCTYIATRQTRESYLEQGETIVSNILDLRHDEQSCYNVLSIIAPFDEFDYFRTITSFDLSIDSERREFCAQFVDAYSPSGTYNPTPYELQSTAHFHTIISSLYSGDPGVVLPGLTFIDLVKIDGAASRGEKVVDGIVVYCTVFEELILQFIGRDDYDISGFCTQARLHDLEAIEHVCRAKFVPGYYRGDRPLWLPPFNFKYESIYILQEISGIIDISKEEICTAADRVLGEIPVSTMVQKSVDIILTDALPFADSVCRNWEETMCYWKRYCPVPEQPPANQHQYYHRYVPSPEFIERYNARFDRIASKLASIISMAAGFENREETCAFVAKTIDPLSGRAGRAFAERTREKILGVLSEVDRCSRLVDKGLDFLLEEFQEDIPREVTNVLNQLTGYATSREFCKAVADSFGTVSRPTTSAPSEAKATYNIIADIAVYIQRVARSVKK